MRGVVRGLGRGVRRGVDNNILRGVVRGPERGLGRGVRRGVDNTWCYFRQIGSFCRDSRTVLMFGVGYWKLGANDIVVIVVCGM